MMAEINVVPTPLTGSWNEQKRKLKKRFLNLTDRDVYYEFGKKSEMLDKIQLKLGKTREELVAIISAL